MNKRSKKHNGFWQKLKNKKVNRSYVLTFLALSVALIVIIAASVTANRTKKPTEKHFYGICNEFLWVSAYVAKGLARGELTFARTCMEEYTHDALRTMLEVYVGVKNDFSVAIGKSGKYLPKFLSPELWERYLATFPDIRIENMWAALYRMQELFHEVGTETAAALGYSFPEEEYRKMQNYLHMLQEEAGL